MSLSARRQQRNAQRVRHVEEMERYALNTTPMEWVADAERRITDLPELLTGERRSCAYEHGKQMLLNAHAVIPMQGVGSLPLLRIALLNDEYVPQPERHRCWHDIEPWEIGGMGYTPGGQLLESPVFVRQNDGHLCLLSSPHPSWGSWCSFKATYSVLMTDFFDANDALLLSCNFFGGVQSIHNGTFTVIQSPKGWLSTCDDV